ncbi:thiol-disulfide oxidoreductase DCC family protein [Winogradskyella sp.]|uniref:thiol-disulfide oxidoreductase DCC family protein n=1 Tax=Winogradskyella sp. TaxID=1883156 RepID=UPI0025F12B6C|nr:DUF393 domain-containing protein [Winogradskyella sp.]MBT8243898.1 DUF393 domain-containing protein [Winogradskyella sp.]
MKNSYILFDGDCGFCNHTIMFIAERDLNGKFTFVSSNSVLGKKFLIKNKIIGLELKTIILIDKQGEIHTKSKALKRIIIKIPKYKFLGYLMNLMPTILMDFIYMIISKRRKQIIRKNSCKIPSLEIRQRFILE